MVRSNRRAAIAVALVLPFIGILLLHARYYLPFVSDDALISLRYANRLLDGNGLTWTDGRAVEGYSNLLWILVVALPGIFGMDLLDAARLLGLAGIVVVMFTISYWCIRTHPIRAAWFPIAFALLFLSVSAPMAVWAIGGLEQPLFAALIALSIPLMYRVLESDDAGRKMLLACSVILGLICLTRPDGPIFAVAAAGSLVLVSWFTRRTAALGRCAVLLLFPAACYAGQIGFRAWYYGELVPNTALVKFAPSSAHLREGTRYLWDGFRALSPLSLVALVSLFGSFLSRGRRARAVYLLATAAMWAAYVVLIGGDIFPAYRHFVPLIVVFAFALVEGGAIVVSGLLSRPRYLYPVMACSLLLFIPYVRVQFANKHNQRAVTERWEWQCKEVALLLKSAFWKQQPLLAVTAAGCLPYWSELPALDMMGLNDYYLPRHRPADFGAGWLGHELGDGRYVLSRSPDLIVFSVGSEPAFRSGQELQGMAEFRERYVPVTARTDAHRYTALVYVDKYSAKVGIRRSASTIVMPGFLFAGEGTTAHLDAAGRLVAQITAEQPARVQIDSDPAQAWVLDVSGSHPADVTGELKQEGRSLSVTLRSRGIESVEISEVVLRRAPASAAVAPTAQAPAAPATR